MAKQFQKGDRVFAKVRGYPAWPARIEEIEYNDSGKSKFHVMFYGTYETSICKIDDLFHYNEHKEEYGKPMKRKGFNEALDQIENNTPFPISVPKPDMKIKYNNQSSYPTDSVNKNVKSKKVTSKRKRDSGIESPLKTSTAQNNQNVAPPRKRLKMSPNGISSNFIKTDIVSRSGRRIRPKKFSDDTLSDSIDSNSSSGRSSTAGNIQGTKSFKDPKATLLVNSALRRKRSIRNVSESEISSTKYSFTNNSNKMDKNENSEHEPVQKVIKMDRLTWFRNEARFLELENTIRSHLSVNSANTEKAIEALQQLNTLNLHPLMLKKYPRVVQTINKLRRYVGNVETWNFSEEQKLEFCEEAENIRSEAESAFIKFKALFYVPEGFKFSKIFQEQVSEFKKLTLSLSHEEMCSLTQDPTSVEAKFGTESDEENYLGEITNKTKLLDDSYSEYIKRNISLCDVSQDPMYAAHVEHKIDLKVESDTEMSLEGTDAVLFHQDPA